MAKVNSFLAERLKMATSTLSKMTNLAEMSSKGGLSSFSGVFRVTPLGAQEKEKLSGILDAHKEENYDVATDLRLLADITAEVRAINAQAAILHGERIKKAQDLLKAYRDGAFTAWLIAAYGNRQTPYNFLQYYELHQSVPQTLYTKLEEMPKQAVYILASRSGSQERKEEIIRNYQGEPKEQLLATIRESFPLAVEDKRAHDPIDQAIAMLQKIEQLLSRKKLHPSLEQKKTLQRLLSSLQDLIPNVP